MVWIVGTGRKKAVEIREEGKKEKEGASEASSIRGGARGRGERGGGGKEEGESWVDWIKRATKIGEDHLKKLKIEDWITRSRVLKWRWAGHIARRTDNRWSTALLLWEPEGGKRRVGHPKARWRDDMDNFIKQYMVGQTFDWYLIAQDRDSWASLEDEYACGVQRGR